eukprot:m.261713 g.261713  ORF g.261713 m.261713 type:complete len:181 (+) comp17603_c0_seq3:2621-3163(+)
MRWMEIYGTLPHNDTNGVQMAPLTWTLSSTDLPRTAANLRVHCVGNLTVATVDLPTFYNTIFVPNLRPLLLSFSPTRNANIVPYPRVKAVGSVAMAPTTAAMHQVGNTRLFLSPIMSKSSNPAVVASSTSAVCPPQAGLLNDQMVDEDDMDDEEASLMQTGQTPLRPVKAVSKRRAANRL